MVLPADHQFDKRVSFVTHYADAHALLLIRYTPMPDASPFSCTCVPRASPLDVEAPNLNYSRRFDQKRR